MSLFGCVGETLKEMEGTMKISSMVLHQGNVSHCNTKIDWQQLDKFPVNVTQRLGTQPQCRVNFWSPWAAQWPFICVIRTPGVVKSECGRSVTQSIILFRELLKDCTGKKDKCSATLPIEILLLQKIPALKFTANCATTSLLHAPYPIECLCFRIIQRYFSPNIRMTIKICQVGSILSIHVNVLCFFRAVNKIYIQGMYYL